MMHPFHRPAAGWPRRRRGKPASWSFTSFALFVLLMAAAGYSYLRLSWLTMAIGLTLAVLFLSIDILSRARS